MSSRIKEIVLDYFQLIVQIIERPYCKPYKAVFDQNKKLGMDSTLVVVTEGETFRFTMFADRSYRLAIRDAIAELVQVFPADSVVTDIRME